MRHNDGKRLLSLIVENLPGVTRGPWKVFEGSSWRRIGRDVSKAGAPFVDQDDCAVLAPTLARDGHPDLTASRGNDRDANLAHIVRCDPDTISLVAGYVEELETRLANIDRAVRDYDGSSAVAPLLEFVRTQTSSPDADGEPK